MKLRISGGRVIDPANGVDAEADVLISDGRVEGLLPPSAAGAGEQVIDARGCVVAPGFVDLHCHFGEPGREDVETLASGTAAAAAGGFTTVCCMPDTVPSLDNAAAIEGFRSRARSQAQVRVLPLGTVSRGRSGAELAEMAEMADAGAVAFSDDARPVAGDRLMRHALEYSLLAGRPVVDHAEQPELTRDGQMHEGELATILGLRGIPPEAEEIAVARDLALARLTGARLHLAHLSTARAVELVRGARAEGVAVTAEVTPHHLTWTDRLIAGDRAASCYNTLAKVSPPLRTQVDVLALRAGLRDGTIDAIATDHSPQRRQDKECEFGLARAGIAGLETALALILRMAAEGEVGLEPAIAALTIGPSRAFGLPYGTLSPGAPGDVVVFDPEAPWVVDVERFRSMARNNPLHGQAVRGRVRATIVEGEVVFREEG